MDDEANAPTLRDIADAAGVSVASVSKVLNNRSGVGEESRRKILDIAERYGYQGKTARSLHRAGVDSVAMLMPAEFYSRSQFYEDVIRGALDEAAAHSLKIDVRLVSLDSVVAEVEELLQAGKTGAIVAIGLDQPEALERIIASKLPAVLINGMDRTMRLNSVLPDNWSAGWLATQRLLSAGHREIVHVTLPHRLSLRRRLEGFKVAIEEAGIRFDPQRHVLDLSKFDVQESQTQQVVRQVLQDGSLADATAFFCSTDIVALGVMQALQSNGFSIPDDFSVIGLDDIAVALHSRPPLTTIRIDRLELGRAGIQMLMKRIADPGANIVRVNIGVRLVERATVGPVRKKPL